MIHFSRVVCVVDVLLIRPRGVFIEIVFLPNVACWLRGTNVGAVNGRGGNE